MKKRLILCLVVFMSFFALFPVQAEGNTGKTYRLVYNIKDDRVISSENGDEKMYPASITKLMTVLVAYDEVKDRLDETIVFQDKALTGLFEIGASTAGFQPDQVVSYRDLLYGTLLPSGADATQQLAISLFGDEKGFVEKMNEKAKELGMKNTHFANTSGLHEDNHYTTPNDLLILFKEFLKNDELKTMSTIPTYVSSDGNTHMVNTIESRKQELMYESYHIQGGKTGFTFEAGDCLLSFGTAAGEEWIVLVGNEKSIMGYEALEVSERIYEDINKTMKRVTVFKKGGTIKKLSIPFKSGDDYIVKAQEEYSFMIDKDVDVSQVKAKFTSIKDLEAPIDKGKKIGSLTFTLDGKELKEIDINATYDVKRNTVAYITSSIVGFFKTFWLFILLIVGIVGANLFYLRKRQKTKRRYYTKSKRKIHR